MPDHANTVRAGAAFYMTHQYRSVPGQDAERHEPEGCKGCAAEAALDALVAERDEARSIADGMARAPYGELESMRERMEAAEADRDRVRKAAHAYLDRHQQMKGAVLGGGDFLLLAQAEDDLRDALDAIAHAALKDTP